MRWRYILHSHYTRYGATPNCCEGSNELSGSTISVTLFDCMSNNYIREVWFCFMELFYELNVKDGHKQQPVTSQQAIYYEISNFKILLLLHS
jgi:hypothetical protein